MISLSTSLSPAQLVTLWGELEDCYRGENWYGSHTAEIYAYTLLPNNPLVVGDNGTVGEEAKREAAKAAARALDEVLQAYLKFRECTARIEGERYDGETPPFLHRVHVSILHGDRK